MQRVLVHLAMVLLGVTLTVSFYEGRRLVKNTERALTAATTLSAAGGRRTAREDLASDDEALDAGATDLSPSDATPLPAGARPMRLDPSQMAASRLKMRPALAAGPGGEQGDVPRGRRGGRRGGRRMRAVGGPEVPADLAAGAQARVEQAEQEMGPLAVPADPLEEDTAAPE